jgi:4-hydroxy-3-polyprenylbenzoate decarboxylase
MENARKIWERLGLPKLTPQSPWHGYELGDWSQEMERQAQMAVRGEYYALGEELARMRRGDVGMNTRVEPPPKGGRS